MELKLRVFKGGKMYGHTEAVRLIYNKTILNEDGEFIIKLFTGKHDKNGTEIYQDDIIVFKDERFIVCWLSDGMMFSMQSTDKKGRKYIVHANYLDRCEIIGNKEQNPDLIKG